MVIAKQCAKYESALLLPVLHLLKLLVAQMMTDANDWTRLHIVPSEEAATLAMEMQEAGLAPK